MKTVLSFVALISLAAASSTLPSGGKVLSSCAADARVLVKTRNFTVGGHEIQVSTKACSANIVTSRSFGKRQTLLCDTRQATTFECATGLPPPVIADCDNLRAALPGFVATQPPFFEPVAPQFLQSVTLGTCEYAWINNNPVGGATLEGCWSDMEEFGSILTSGCIEVGEPAGIAFPTVPLAIPNDTWIFEFVCLSL
ncbi:hypothetical protein GGX14DRAFT_392014 [Mycena pura]|uniref:Cyanovirin-N domain-containing protein n=1 Tax=Mycena pura TaxID=153505 RepID=A0AAD6VTL5_9AGAR|nr:hypothetical protein GGX14DRAFT_392014 [Mycena pura]